MIGLGGAIGTGLFMGSGVAIGYAGPAVILSYAIAAIAAVAMVFSLSEMAVMHPTAGSFGTYAEIYLNPWAGIVARYSYWMAQVIAVGAEAVAAGIYMTFYFPGTPVWIWSVGFAFVLLYFNSRSVNNFGSIEYWFALIKVVAIVIFIILGLATILGLWTKPVGFHNLTGLAGRIHAARIRRRVDGGDPRDLVVQRHRSHRRHVRRSQGSGTHHPRGTAQHGAAAVSVLHPGAHHRRYLCSLDRNRRHGRDAKPVRAHFRALRHPPCRRHHELRGVERRALQHEYQCLFVLADAVLPVARRIRAGILGQARQERHADRGHSGFRRLHPDAAALSKLTPLAYNYLFGVALFDAMIVWIIILLSHLSFRRRHKRADLPVRTPGFPVVQIAGLLLLCAVLVTMGLDQETWQISWIVGIPWLRCCRSAISSRKRGARKAAAAAPAPHDAGS